MEAVFRTLSIMDLVAYIANLIQQLQKINRTKQTDVNKNVHLETDYLIMLVRWVKDRMLLNKGYSATNRMNLYLLPRT